MPNWLERIRPRPSLAHVNDELNVQRLLTMARHQPVAATAHTVNSLTLTALTVAEGVASAALIFLQVLMLLAAAHQFRSWLRHRGRGRPAQVPQTFVTRATVQALIFGCLWGAFGATLLWGTPPRDVELTTCVVLTGMLAGGTAMLFGIPRAVVTFLIPTTLPPVAVLISRSPESGLVIAGLATIYLACLLAAALTWYAGFVDGVTLRLKNAELAAKADAANRAKSRFLANMSHELRTPLNAIVGFAEMIDRQFHGPVGNPRYLEFARAIHDGGSHLGELIDDILDLSKIEAGTVELSVETRTPASIIEEAITLVRPALEKSGLALDVTHEPGMAHVVVDPRRLRQSIANVLSNAVKFTPRNGRIRIETRRGADGVLLIMIGDTGVGIDREELGEITKPFVQGRAADTLRMRGAGLGLSIAEQLMQLHGGALWINSTAGVGTVVTLVLPKSRLVDAKTAKAAG